MKTKTRFAMSLGIAMTALSLHAQGTFVNLDFESATLSPVPINSGTALYVSVDSALPGWSAYLGAVQQTQVIQNDYGHGQAEVDILGPNYPAAGPSPGELPGTIDGNYTVLLQQGGGPAGTSTSVNASIAQTGFVPLGSQSLQFSAWTTGQPFSVSFNGNNLTPVVLGTRPNYTLYGVNISPYAGETGTLEFSALSGTGASWLGLDDITFSPIAVTPEPNTLVLTGIGGLLFALYRRFAPKH